mmetsp:Transcript_39541/g.112124  ORF Transcript_39541/g.112124 Transcript_39541/m.112124 type:complete len:283 (-) Transcript_39541:223-1071(-)
MATSCSDLCMYDVVADFLVDVPFLDCPSVPPLGDTSTPQTRVAQVSGPTDVPEIRRGGTSAKRKVEPSWAAPPDSPHSLPGGPTANCRTAADHETLGTAIPLACSQYAHLHDTKSRARDSRGQFCASTGTGNRRAEVAKLRREVAALKAQLGDTQLLVLNLTAHLHEMEQRHTQQALSLLRRLKLPANLTAPRSIDAAAAAAPRSFASAAAAPAPQVTAFDGTLAPRSASAAAASHPAFGGAQPPRNAVSPHSAFGSANTKLRSMDKEIVDVVNSIIGPAFP